VPHSSSGGHAAAAGSTTDILQRKLVQVGACVALHRLVILCGPIDTLLN